MMAGSSASLLLTSELRSAGAVPTQWHVPKEGGWAGQVFMGKCGHLCLRFYQCWTDMVDVCLFFHVNVRDRET